MALNRSKNYGTRWETSSEESPQGKFKDKSSETAVDGSYLQKSWINDISDGWNGAILKGYVPTQEQLDAVNPLGFNNNAGVIGTPVNEIIDKANDSQVYNAWYKHTQEISNTVAQTVAQDVVDTTISNKQIEEKIAELETIAEGCFFNYYSGIDNSVPLYASGDAAFYSFESDTHVGNNISIDSDTKKIKIEKKGLYVVSFARYAVDNQLMTPSGNVFLFKDVVDTSVTTRPEDEIKEFTESYNLVIGYFGTKGATGRGTFNKVNPNAPGGTEAKGFLQLTNSLFAPNTYFNVENDNTTLSLWSEADFSYGFSIGLQRMGAYQPSLTLPVVEGND